MTTIPKAPGFDGATFQTALDENIRRPDGKPYAVFKQFREWKLWVERVRDGAEANRIATADLKRHVDSLDARESSHHANQNTRIAALEAAVAANPPFPA